jgi:ribosome recycling factor
MMVEEIKHDAKQRMSKSIEALRQELTKLRTGRAHAGLLDHVMVSYYGSDVPISQVASVTVPDARTINVQPWERKMIPEVEKAIRSADLGLNPVTTSEVIRVPLPALTEERRREMTRLLRQEAENANQQLKTLIKEESLAKDEEHRAEEDIQKLTDQFIGQVDEILKEKEADLMEI